MISFDDWRTPGALRSHWESPSPEGFRDSGPWKRRRPHARLPWRAVCNDADRHDPLDREKEP